MPAIAEVVPRARAGGDATGRSPGGPGAPVTDRPASTTVLGRLTPFAVDSLRPGRVFRPSSHSRRPAVGAAADAAVTPSAEETERREVAHSQGAVVLVVRNDGGRDVEQCRPPALPSLGSTRRSIHVARNSGGGDGALVSAILLGLANVGQWFERQEKDAEIVRQRATITDLEGKCRQLEAESRQREDRIAVLERENATLKAKLAATPAQTKG